MNLYAECFAGTNEGLLALKRCIPGLEERGRGVDVKPTAKNQTCNQTGVYPSGHKHSFQLSLSLTLSLPPPLSFCLHVEKGGDAVVEAGVEVEGEEEERRRRESVF